MMKKYRLFPAICLVAALLLSACSQDEPGENSTALPEGEYPLQIGSVTLTAEVSEQPWTRVSENPTDGMSSVWKDGDKIGVRIGDNEETGIYVVDVDIEGSVVGVTPEKPVYWKDKQPAIITAWYPVKEELDFTHQDQGLTYLLQGTSSADYNTSANLTFSHRLAKVRVKLEGAKANEVTAVTVRSYPTSTHVQGTLNKQDTSLPTPYVPMREATYDGVKYWEANLRPGTLQANNSFEVAKAEGDPVRVTLDANVPITAGQVHTINISVNPVIPENATDITNTTGEINDEGDYVVSGERNTTINITGGSPTIYLDRATVAVGSGNAINITEGNPTIYVVGEDNTISSDNGAGIYVAESSIVTIKGSSKDDELIIRGGNGNSGIGGYIKSDHHGVSCGDITISNITVSVYGSAIGYTGDMSPGIGCSGNATCGTIDISSATVHAFGITDIDNGYSVPGIGTGITVVAYPKNLPDVIAFNSEIYAYRGNPGGTCDYIGWAADLDYPSTTTANSAINPGAGSIKSSTVYCYTGDTLDKTVVYDENGGGKEQ